MALPLWVTERYESYCIMHINFTGRERDGLAAKYVFGQWRPFWCLNSFLGFEGRATPWRPG
eukprot:scaffold32497_cov17-Prasinocladus_malaysianus.AAC.1